MLKIYQKPNLVDLLQVCERMPEDEREQYEAFTGEKYDSLKLAAQRSFAIGPSWVVADGNLPILVAGFDQIRANVYQDWMISTPEAWNEKNWRGTTRIAKKVMAAMLDHTAHRLQCVSLRSRIQAHRWYATIGLREEGVLTAYGVDGQDAIMFARVREEK